MFDKLFNFESPFMRAMTRIFDTTELNLLWLLCCVPVVTVGPSTVAFYSAMSTLIRDEETKIHRDFFRAFLSNFKKNFLAGILLLIVGVFLGVDVYLAYKAGKGIYTFFMVFFGVMFFLWAMITQCTFLLLAESGHDFKILQVIALAFVLSLRHLHRTLLTLFFTVLLLWLCHLAPVCMLFGFGLLVEFQSHIFSPVLKQYISLTGHPAHNDQSQEAE